MNLVRALILYIKNVKLTISVPVKIPVIKTLVPPVRSLKKIPDVALMMHLTALVVRRQVALNIHQQIHLLSEQMALTAANILATTPVILTVRQLTRTLLILQGVPTAQQTDAETSLVITPCLAILVRDITNVTDLGNTAQGQPVPTAQKGAPNIV